MHRDPKNTLRLTHTTTRQRADMSSTGMAVHDECFFSLLRSLNSSPESKMVSVIVSASRHQARAVAVAFVITLDHLDSFLHIHIVTPKLINTQAKGKSVKPNAKQKQS